MSINYQDTLPDPSNPIGNAGQNTGTNGPGYRSVALSSKSKTMKSITNSGRMVRRSNGLHSWDISISYNPMTREEFEPINAFLMHKRGSFDSFFVSLPQHKEPQNAGFLTHLNASNVISVYHPGDGGVLAAGRTSLSADGMPSTPSYAPEPGDMFTITDPSDTRHTKAYKVTQVETSTAGTFAGSSAPSSDQRIIHFIPALVKSVTNDSVIKFLNPKIRVVLSSDVQEHSLDVDGLYSFSLKLEESQS